MKSSIYGYNSNNDKLVMLVALWYTKDINCLIYNLIHHLKRWTFGHVTKEKRKHGGGDVITGSVPAIGIPCFIMG